MVVDVVSQRRSGLQIIKQTPETGKEFFLLRTVNFLFYFILILTTEGTPWQVEALALSSISRRMLEQYFHRDPMESVTSKKPLIKNHSQ